MYKDCALHFDPIPSFKATGLVVGVDVGLSDWFDMMFLLGEIKVTHRAADLSSQYIDPCRVFALNSDFKAEKLRKLTVFLCASHRLLVRPFLCIDVLQPVKITHLCCLCCGPKCLNHISKKDGSCWHPVQTTANCSSNTDVTAFLLLPSLMRFPSTCCWGITGFHSLHSEATAPSAVSPQTPYWCHSQHSHKLPLEK